ncbi:MAG: hypothetical protein Q9159_003845 [Coniocarpon cinnabarinum]
MTGNQRHTWLHAFEASTPQMASSQGDGKDHVVNIAFKSLLRALLRQARRLSDPASRTYISRHISHRFRARHDSPDPTWRRQRHLRAARRDLNALAKANAGYLAPNLKVLMLTYGRTGRRRAGLLSSFISRNLEDLRTSNTSDVVAHWLPGLHPSNLSKIPSPTSSHVALLRSQMSTVNGLVHQRHVLRRLSPNIPALNAWRRPMPQKRLINAGRAHWRMLMEKSMPPLDAKEWDRLRLLALGQHVPSSMRHKTAKLQGPILALDEDDENHLGDVLSDLSHLQKKLRTERDIMTGARTRPHMVDARFMRRLWAQVFAICPKMSWDREKNRWRVVWGVEALRDARRGKNAGNSAAFEAALIEA